MAITAATEPTLATSQVRFSTDQLGLEVIIVPDHVARRMAREVEAGWREQCGYAHGESCDFPPGTWMHDMVTTLMAAYAVSPVPSQYRTRERARAGEHRAEAASRLHLVPSIGGASDWDEHNAMWRALDANADLRPPGHAWASCWNPHAYTFKG